MAWGWSMCCSGIARLAHYGLVKSEFFLLTKNSAPVRGFRNIKSTKLHFNFPQAR
jgi:hypothetical protein